MTLRNVNSGEMIKKASQTWMKIRYAKSIDDQDYGVEFHNNARVPTENRRLAQIEKFLKDTLTDLIPPQQFATRSNTSIAEDPHSPILTNQLHRTYLVPMWISSLFPLVLHASSSPHDQHPSLYPSYMSRVAWNAWACGPRMGKGGGAYDRW